MYIFPTIEALQNWVKSRREAGETIGFAPTMGALHEGHLSLFAAAKEAGHTVVSSVFVNPTQFNETADLERYPRTLAADIALLKKQGFVEALFVPSVKEMYPSGTEITRNYDFGELLNVMEGAHRKGHFEGVAQVVKRLLDAVGCDALFMGQKDFQQTAIIRRMLELEKMATELVICTTLRETDGLAMSSRNRLLEENERIEAARLNEGLFQVKKEYKKQDLGKTIADAIAYIEQNGLMKIEYLQVADRKTLQIAKNWDNFEELVVCTALRIGKVRLIDNVLIP